MFTIYVCVCVCVWFMCYTESIHVEVRQPVGIDFYHLGPGDWTQAVRLAASFFTCWTIAPAQLGCFYTPQLPQCLKILSIVTEWGCVLCQQRPGMLPDACTAQCSPQHWRCQGLLWNLEPLVSHFFRLLTKQDTGEKQTNKRNVLEGALAFSFKSEVSFANVGNRTFYQKCIVKKTNEKYCHHHFHNELSWLSSPSSVSSALPVSVMLSWIQSPLIKVHS